MTLLSSFGIVPRHRGHMVAPRHLALSEITLIVSVKNNQAGIERLLDACMMVFSPEQHPATILIVDNLSSPPLSIPAVYRTWGLPVQVLVCTRPGAAAARNMGARYATTPWLLFLDSDCIPTMSLIDGYRQALDGSVGYAGITRAAGDDAISQYYDTQGILYPLPHWMDGEERPAYLITANALVWRPALFRIGGFDERFQSTGGEDIDLGLRLWERGTLAYAPSAQVLHAFNSEMSSFIQRFVWYGKGNRCLAARYRMNLAPQPFGPLQPHPVNYLFSTVHYLALWYGYYRTQPGRQWRHPSSFPSWETNTSILEDHLHHDQRSAEKSKDGIIVLIDGDCTSPAWIISIEPLLAELGSIATGIVCSKACSAPRWKEAQTQVTWLAETVIGDADAFLAKKVKSLLRTDSKQAFCLVTSDKDFVPVVRWIKDAGRTVWGLGAPNASAVFQKACDRFLPFPVNSGKQQLISS